MNARRSGDSLSGVYEQINQIETEIRDTSYNKATQLHIGRLKAKLARLKGQRETKGSHKGTGYAPKKSGDATCVPVSYTHLRAHETDSYLVCRLLLEKK